MGGSSVLSESQGGELNIFLKDVAPGVINPLEQKTAIKGLLTL